jgi:hypothetical protein
MLTCLFGGDPLTVIKYYSLNEIKSYCLLKFQSFVEDTNRRSYIPCFSNNIDKNISVIPELIDSVFRILLRADAQRRV